LDINTDYMYWRDYAKQNHSITGGINQLKHEIVKHRREYAAEGVIIEMHQAGGGVRAKVLISPSARMAFHLHRSMNAAKGDGRGGSS